MRSINLIVFLSTLLYTTSIWAVGNSEKNYQFLQQCLQPYAKFWNQQGDFCQYLNSNDSTMTQNEREVLLNACTEEDSNGRTTTTYQKRHVPDCKKDKCLRLESQTYCESYHGLVVEMYEQYATHQLRMKIQGKTEPTGPITSYIKTLMGHVKVCVDVCNKQLNPSLPQHDQQTLPTTNKQPTPRTTNEEILKRVGSKTNE